MSLRLGSRITAILLYCSAAAMALFIALFLVFNKPGLTHFMLLCALGAGYGLVYAWLACHLALRFWRGELLGRTSQLSRIGLFLCALSLLYLFLENTVLDYYQPLSLYDEAIAALALAWSTLVIVLFIAALRGVVSRLLWPLCLVALLGVPAAGLPGLVSNPQPVAGLLDHRDLFVGGEDGYSIYRIPALLVLPEGSILANGTQLIEDRVLAIAEARRDSALDTGVIDLVQKTSDDGGLSWSSQKVICSYEKQGQRGKCGNATPVFDAERGVVLLAYNLSGIRPGSDHPGGKANPAHRSMIARSSDGGDNWSRGIEVASDNFVFGPGHGVQKKLAPARGRLVIPGYTDRARVLLSDDGGKSWQRGAPLDTGNETAVVELSDGRLYLNTRHRAPIGRPPQPNGRLYSHSDDGGVNWTPSRVDTALITPVCQVSLQTTLQTTLQTSRQADQQQLLLFSNPAHHRARAGMTVRYSPDDGRSWPVSSLVYRGPSGYSELAVLSDGTILLLYERGRISYSEKISMARLPVPDLRLLHRKKSP